MRIQQCCPRPKHTTTETQHVSSAVCQPSATSNETSLFIFTWAHVVATSLCSDKLLCSLKMYSSSCAYLSVQVLPIVGNVWIILGGHILLVYCWIEVLFISTIQAFEGLYDDTVYCLLFMVKNFRCFMSSPSFPKTFAVTNFYKLS